MGQTALHVAGPEGSGMWGLGQRFTAELSCTRDDKPVQKPDEDCIVPTL